MDDELDITQDLTDGSDGALGDVLPQEGAQPTNNPAGDAQPVHQSDDVVPVNKQTIRDTLSSAFKGEEAPADDKKPATPAEVPELSQDAEGRWRTKDGMFASQEQISAYEAAQAQQQQPADEYATLTTRFTPQEQEQFKALPAELRQFVGRTMEAVTAQAGRYNEYEQLEQHLIGPRRQAWAAQGMNPAVAINQLFALSDFAGRDPKSFVLWFAENNGVDLDAALDERDQQQSADPQVLALQRQVASMQQIMQGNNTTQQQEAQNANLATVQAFAQETDGAGKPKRPYLTQVMDTFAHHVSAVRAANPALGNSEVLQKAYEAACWANPQVRGAMQKEMQDAQRQQEQARVNKARIAGASIAGGPTGNQHAPNPQDSNLSLRDELKQQFASSRA